MTATYQERRSSGVESLGEIPSHWAVTALKRVLSEPLKYGATEPGNDSDPDSPRYLRITDFDGDGSLREDTFVSLPEEIARHYYLLDGDVLFARSGATVGKTFLFRNYSGRACFAGYLIKASTARHQLTPEFLTYFTRSPAYDAWKDSIFTQATIQNIGADKYSRLPICLPPLPEQQRIAAYLDASCAAIDAAVAAKRRQLETLDALRKSTIKRAVMTGLNPLVPMKRTDVEWIPEMPEHWRMVRVKDAMEFFNTVRVPLSAAERGVMTEKTYDYYGASGVIDKVEAYHFDGTYILIAEDGANLLTRSKPLAFLATGKFWVNNHAHILKPRFGGDDTFFVSLLESQDFSLFVTGAAQPKLTMENLGRFKLAIPREPEQKEIAAFIRKKDAEFHPLFGQIERQIETLVSYRKSLIHECVTGQRRITEVDLREMGATAILPADASFQGATTQ
jgi:type I restriction enzyme S subunit